MKRKIFFIIGLIITGLPAALEAEESLLAKEDLIQALKNEVSGEIAFRYTVRISQFDRIQAGEGFHAAAEWIKLQLESFGYPEVAIEGWPSNGSRYVYTYQTPIGWRAEQGELWMTSPRSEKLCSYEEIPLTLVKHSNSAEVEAELIDVGTGVGDESYREKDVKGKIVLATAYTGGVMQEAVVKRGALGVITWFSPEERPGYPNMIRYTAIWPKWEEREKIGFGFNVSKQQGWELKKMLESGDRVVLRALVKAEYYDSKIEILTAAIPGTEEPEKEILIVGHLCHPQPSANDNGSGSGGMLEMARALKKMIDRGDIPAPKRTIRFLWVPEFYGTVPYIKEHLERTRNTLSVINCDMIGEDLHLTGGTFNITCTPDSIPSYLNDVVVNFTRLADSLNLNSMNGSRHPFAYRIMPYSGGSDHVVFNDGAVKAPAVMFGHGDTFHHTSLDTPDKVDPSELRRVCFVALGASLYMASAGADEGLDMARLTTRNGIGRISRDYYDALNTLWEKDKPGELQSAYKQALNMLTHAVRRESDAVFSTKIFSKQADIKANLELMVDNFGALEKSLLRDAEINYRNLCRKMGIQADPLVPSDQEKAFAVLVPLRSPEFVCPLQMGYLEYKLGTDVTAGLRLRGNKAYEALNFVNGRRSVTDIAMAVAAEYGPTDPQDIHDFFRVLEKAGLMTFK